MRFNSLGSILAALSLLAPTHAINIISSNDDGWAKANIRALFQSLTAAGYSVVVSAPAEDQSATGLSVQVLPNASLDIHPIW
jgi:5'/3'-nucleotidase SurE